MAQLGSPPLTLTLSPGYRGEGTIEWSKRRAKRKVSTLRLYVLLVLESMLSLLYTFLSVAVGVLAIAVGLSLLPRIWLLGGRRAADHLARCRCSISSSRASPGCRGSSAFWCRMAGWAGRASRARSWRCWRGSHGTSGVHRDAVRGPTICRTLNRIVGAVPEPRGAVGHVLALPGFWIIRLQQISVYPLLVWLLGFPQYRARRMGQRLAARSSTASSATT